MCTLLIRYTYMERKAKQKNVTKLANFTGRIWWLSLDLTVLINHKSKTRKEYFSFKRIISTLRTIYLEEKTI